MERYEGLLLFLAISFLFWFGIWFYYAIADRELLKGNQNPEDKMPLINRARAESAVGETDCTGRKYTPIEWEDNVRYVLWGAAIQRDKDFFDAPGKG